MALHRQCFDPANTQAVVYEQQMRFLARGRLIPFRLLMWAPRQHWSIHVLLKAENVMGTIAHLGQGQRALIHTFMVHPTRQQQGLGQALLHTQLKHLQTLGCQWVWADVLAQNTASLQAFRRVGFAPYATQTSLELPTADSFGRRSPRRDHWGQDALIHWLCPQTFIPYARQTRGQNQRRCVNQSTGNRANLKNQ